MNAETIIRPKQHRFGLKHATTVAAALALVIASAPAEARGGGRGWGGFAGAGGWHGGFRGGGFPRESGWRGDANGASAFSQDQKHSEDPYVKAASEEEERVLKKLNSICRGC